MQRSFRTLRLCAYTRGFTPGWYAVPRWGTPNTLKRPSGAGSVRSEPWRRTAKTPRAQRENPSSPEPPQRAQDRSRGAPKNRSGAGSDRSKHWKRSNPSPRAQRESRSSPELPCVHRTGPAEPPKIAAERDRTEASTGSDQALPLAHSAKAGPSPSFPASEGSVPRSPITTTHQSTTVIFPRGRQSPPIEGQAPNQPSGSGTGPERALERRHPDPRRATARKPSRPQRSLRAQDRSRGAPSPQHTSQRQLSFLMGDNHPP
jgi:hypothetical protein